VDFRARERLVLSTGLTAAGLIAFALVAGIAGSAALRRIERLDDLTAES